MLSKVRKQAIMLACKIVEGISKLGLQKYTPQSIFQPTRTYLLKQLRRMLRRTSIWNLKKNERLWQELNAYQERTKSTGCSWSDLWILYNTVRARKPKEILECGPGVSTLVMAYALFENEKEGYRGKITAMEELEYYFDMATKLLPDYLHSYVEFILSPRIEANYYLFRGVCYRDIPDRAYDFVFVDGPDLHAPSDGELSFDFDFIDVVRNTANPVFGIVDYRLSTSFVFQAVFGLEKAKFSAIHELGFIGPCVKDDLRSLNLEHLDNALLMNAKIFGNTEVQLNY